MEQFDNRQLVGLSESQYNQLPTNGQIITCLRELSELNREW